MIGRVAVVLVASVLTLPALASVALADDPSPTARIRPPSTVLQHVDARTLEVPPAARPTTRAKEVVVLVGGYQSCSCIEDDTFDLLKTRLVAAGYDVVRFGQDPRYPYDTYGHIDPSAGHLRDQVRDLGRVYSGVHIVTHSMGGAVADGAFAAGLSSSDGVLTYVSWSGPHSGSDAARALGVVRAVSDDGGLVRDLLLRTRNEPDSDASRDLASVRPVRPPAGVVRLDLREANDLLVTSRDARDPGVPSRVLNNGVPGFRGLDGHGAILVDPVALDLTVTTIATRRVPPDTRALQLVAAAEGQSRGWGALVFIALCVLTIGLCASAPFRGPLTPLVSFGTRLLASRIPAARRKRCA